MMVTAAILVALGVSASTLDGACTDGQLQAYCENVAEVRGAEDLDHLLERPADAAACLIKQLHIVRTPVLKPEDRGRLRDDFRVIWSLRALRYMTHGKNFVASPGSAQLGVKRRQFLTKRSKEEVPFFAVWMSRDIIYVAPEAAQRSIIDQWKRWYEVEGHVYHYREATSYDDWYF